MPSSRKVLFVLPNDCRTGATRMFLDFMTWLKARPDADFLPMVLIRNPSLEHGHERASVAEFKDALGHSGPLMLNPFVRKKSIFFRILGRLWRMAIGWRFRSLKIDAAFFYCLPAHDALKFIDALHLPALTYCLENEFLINKLKENYCELLKRRTVFFAAASKATGAILAEKLAIPKESIKVVYPAK